MSTPNLNNREEWSHAEITRLILRFTPVRKPEDGREPERPFTDFVRKTLYSREGRSQPVPRGWVDECLKRVNAMRQALHGSFAGLHDPSLGELLDWLLATIIARENVLLLGPPGVAKSQIATFCFKLLGLQEPKSNEDYLKKFQSGEHLTYDSWKKRESAERELQKYFHYLVSRFTQPEELFGPVEISLLKQGILTRVNFGLLTGPGVYAAFLDEVFKGSSSILNTLLTLTQERRYFNWSSMQPSDLVTLIGASNEMPGGFATGAAGVGMGGEDFQTLHAFLDRFPVRIEIPSASGMSPENTAWDGTDLGRAFALALGREKSAFVTGEHFESRSAAMPCLNDMLLLGRAMLQDDYLKVPDAERVVDRLPEQRFRQAFIKLATDLQQHATAPALGRVTWTISPRKLRSLYKVALAHALITDPTFVAGNSAKLPLRREDLRVFQLTWDSPMARLDLANVVQAGLAQYCAGANELLARN